MRGSELSAVASRLYAESRKLTQWRQRVRLRICPLERLIEVIPNGSRVLDVGCGDGLLLGLLADGRLISSGIGFDTDRSKVHAARNMAESNGFGELVEFRVHHIASAWPCPNDSFDAVLLVDVMHHLPPAVWPGIWSQVAKALRPGGLLIYKDMARKPLGAALANRMHDLLFSGDWIHYADFDECVQQARACGLHEKSRDRFRRLCYQHEMLVAARA